MASGSIIIASNLKVYKNILKHNYNSVLLDPDNLNEWGKKINEIMKSKKYSFLGKNSKKKVKEFSWKNRVHQIIKFNEK